MRKKWPVILLLILLLLAGGGYLLWRSGLFAAFASLEAMQDYIGRFAPYSHLVYFLIQLLSVILAPIPSNVTALAGGLLFGTWSAFLLTWGAVVLGSVIVFAVARRLGRDFVERVVSRSVIGRYLDVIQRKQDTFLILAFLFPFFPDDVLCILAGLTTMPFRRFLLIALFTRPWGLLAASALGGSTLSLPLPVMLLLAAVGIGVFLVCMKYGDRWEEAMMASSLIRTW